LAVKQQNLAQLEKVRSLSILPLFTLSFHLFACLQTLFDVSDPASKNYGKHLTHEQTNRLVAPSQQTVGQRSLLLLL
jgi:hypothetical protein